MRVLRLVLATGIAITLGGGAAPAQPFIGFPDADPEPGPGVGVKGAFVTVDRGNGRTLSIRTRDDHAVVTVDVNPPAGRRDRQRRDREN
jgi:hypothetical protein